MGVGFKPIDTFRAPHGRIFAALRQQFPVRSGLGNFTARHHQNLIRVFYNRQCMRNHNNCFLLLHQVSDSPLYGQFVFNIKIYRRFVQQQDR